MFPHVQGECTYFQDPVLEISPLHFFVHLTAEHVNITGPETDSDKAPKSLLMIREFIWERVEVSCKLHFMKSCN